MTTEGKTHIVLKEGTFIPAAIAQRCPVCNGFGTLKYGTLICQGCEGKGYVLIPAKKEERV